MWLHSLKVAQLLRIAACLHTNQSRSYLNHLVLKKNREDVIVASKERGLEVNGDKTNYMIMPRDQNAGQSHNINTDNSTFERVEEFRYFGTLLTNQNSIQEEIKSKLKSGNACYLSVQKLLSSSLLSKNIKLRYTEL